MEDIKEINETTEGIYNEICYATMVKMFTRIGDMAETVVPIKHFDMRDDEHLYVLAVARALGGIMGVQVAVEMPFWQRWKMNRKIKVKNSRILPYKKEYDEVAIVPDEILDTIRLWATEQTKDFGFSFGKIYHEFYK